MGNFNNDSKGLLCEDQGRNKRYPTSPNATVSTILFADDLSGNPSRPRNARRSAVCSASNFILNAHNLSSRT